MSTCDKCGRAGGSVGVGGWAQPWQFGWELCGRCARDVSVIFGGWVIPAHGSLQDDNKLTQTERDAARWNAFIGGTSTNRAQLRELLDSFICPSCESVGASRRLVNPLTALVVPWDVMGDSRSFAFVCDGCASGSAVVL